MTFIPVTVGGWSRSLTAGIMVLSRPTKLNARSPNYRKSIPIGWMCCIGMRFHILIISRWVEGIQKHSILPLWIFRVHRGLCRRMILNPADWIWNYPVMSWIICCWNSICILPSKKIRKDKPAWMFSVMPLLPILTNVLIMKTAVTRPIWVTAIWPMM